MKETRPDCSFRFYLLNPVSAELERRPKWVGKSVWVRAPESACLAGSCGESDVPDSGTPPGKHFPSTYGSCARHHCTLDRFVGVHSVVCE